MANTAMFQCEIKGDVEAAKEWIKTMNWGWSEDNNDEDAADGVFFVDLPEDDPVAISLTEEWGMTSYKGEGFEFTIEMP